MISFENLKMFELELINVIGGGGGSIVKYWLPERRKNSYTIEQALFALKICLFIRFPQNPSGQASRLVEMRTKLQRQTTTIHPHPNHTEFRRIERHQFSTLFQRHHPPASATASLRTISCSNSSIHRGVCQPPVPLRCHPLFLHLIISCLQPVPAATRDCLRRKTTSNNRKSSSEGVEPTSRWSSWTNWRGCSMRHTIRTRSWGRNSANVWLCPKPGYRLVN